MPRQGEGHIAHNAVDANAQTHAPGAGPAAVSLPSSSPDQTLADMCKQPNEVAGTHKGAPLPEKEKGLAVEGLHASGGSSQGIKQGSEVGQGASKP